MKRNLLFILMMLVSMMGTRNAVNAQNLTSSDVQNSGCQRGNQRRANENETQRTIVLLKEGNILSVQILGFVSNCATMGFDVTPSMSGGSDGTPCSVSVQVEPIYEEEADCICPFNVSFTLHDLEANSFYFSCWWYEGQVSLTEGEPMTLESITIPAQIGEWYCIIDKVNHTAIVEGVDGGTSELLIPWVLYYEGEHYFVTGIDEDAFLNYKALASVTLPPNLTRIGDLAFAYCDNLTDVYCYADNAPTTGSNVFKGTPIASATLHAPAGSIEMYKATAPWNEFGNIVGEGEVTIDGLNYYLNSSFYTAPLTKGNTWEGELDIPSEISFYGQTYRVTSMDRNAFCDNTKLTKVRIPKNLEGILHGYYTTNPYEDVPNGLISPDHMNPFRGCTALESIEVDEENPSLKSVDGVLFSQDGKGYYYYLTNSYYGTGLYCYPAGARRESYTIPNGVEWIGSGAFGHNQYISTLTIPSSLKQICNNVFAGCNNLKDIYCYAENVPITFSEAFKDFPIASATLHVPAGSVEKYKATAPWSGFGNIVAIEEIAQKYFPEGTKWTEIRLDTMKYDSWYSKVGDEWVPNFETIEYHVQGEFIDERTNDKYSCVYTNGQERTDSLTLLLYNHRIGNNDAGWYGEVTVAAFDNNGQLLWPFYGQMYPLSYEVGTPMSSLNILIAGATGGGWPWEEDEYGTVEEIKEGDFGGVRPLKYSDVNGIRFIQGIGVASWNDGECIFGPIRPYEVLSFLEAVKEEQRHYRSMLVHFERGGEVLYDVWPEKKAATEVEPVTFTAGQMATIILPTTPDTSKGKYYRLDRVEDGQIVFEQELQPRAHVPYIIVPSEDFSIDPSTLDLEGCYRDTVSVDGISFIGSFISDALDYQEGSYIDFIDTTPDCRFEESCVIGALRAYLLVHWDDPYNQGGTKVPPLNKLEIVIRDYGTGVDNVNHNPDVNHAVFDLQGRRVASPRKGIYIKDGEKTVVN